jgi:hypothetical protein
MLIHVRPEEKARAMIHIIRSPASEQQISEMLGTLEDYIKQVHYEALINLRPRHDNMSLRIENAELRDHIEAIVRRLLEVS